MSTSIDTDERIGDLVAADPGRARTFEQLGLDYCCGGRSSLADACAERGLDAPTVIALLVGAAEAPSKSAGHDVSALSLDELCDHIVSAHHDRLRLELPRIAELLEKVVHSHDEPHLPELRWSFLAMSGALEEHLSLEEEVLFPACRDLGRTGAVPDQLDEALLAAHEEDHHEVGAALKEMRGLCDDYRPERALCGTHRVLLHSLHELEIDTHQHVHEENNVLFPRVRELLAAKPQQPIEA